MAVIQKVPYNVIIWLMDFESLLCGSFLSAKDREEIRSKFDITPFFLKMNYCLPHSLFHRFQLRYYLSLQSISVYLSAMFRCIFLPLSSFRNNIPKKDIYFLTERDWERNPTAKTASCRDGMCTGAAKWTGTKTKDKLGMSSSIRRLTHSAKMVTFLFSFYRTILSQLQTLHPVEW